MSDSSIVPDGARERKAILSGECPVEVGKVPAVNGTEYLAILISKPLARTEIWLIESFLDDLGYSHTYRPVNARTA